MMYGDRIGSRCYDCWGILRKGEGMMALRGSGAGRKKLVHRDREVCEATRSWQFPSALPAGMIAEPMPASLIGFRLATPDEIAQGKSFTLWQDSPNANKG